MTELTREMVLKAVLTLDKAHVPKPLTSRQRLMAVNRKKRDIERNEWLAIVNAERDRLDAIKIKHFLHCNFRPISKVGGLFWKHLRKPIDGHQIVSWI